MHDVDTHSFATPEAHVMSTIDIIYLNVAMKLWDCYIMFMLVVIIDW